jgi:mannose-1-phosphate guanylyltransferase/phosphomannomutase
MGEIKAVILAGGQSTRLRPITNTRPKMLVPVVNKPIIDYVVERVEQSGIKECVFTLYYKSDMLIEHLSKSLPKNMRACYVREARPLGTAGSVKNVEDLLKDVFLVVSGDILFDYDLKTVIKSHIENEREATIVLTQVEDVTGLGIANLNSEYKITSFVEKPDPLKVKSRLVNTGIYVLNKSVLSLIEKGKKTDFSMDVFPKLVKQNKLFGFPLKGFWSDIGTFKGLLKAQSEVLNGKTKIAINAPKIAEGIYVEKGAQVDDLEHLVGPALIASESRVNEGVALRSSVLGRGCEIKRNCTIIHSLLMESTTVEEESELVGIVTGVGSRITRQKRLFGPTGYADYSVV